MGRVGLTTVILLACFFLGKAGAESMMEPKTGGPCEYKAYPGSARIISIRETIGAPGSPERYEVKFVFTPTEKVEEPFAQVQGKEFLLMVGNTYAPTKRFLEKYGIETGRIFEGYLKVIVRGTCTPVLFEFPSINLYDYDAN